MKPTTGGEADIADLIAGLLDIAKVDGTKRADAAEWLRPRLESLPRSKKAVQRLLPPAQQRRLTKLGKLAAKLKTEFDAICAGRDPEDVLLYAGLFLHVQRPDLNRLTQNIRRGVAALRRKNGRPQSFGRHVACTIALSFFERFSEVKAQPWDAGPFAAFCTRLCERTLGTPKDQVPSAIIRALLDDRDRVAAYERRLAAADKSPAAWLKSHC
jgi:hypothetical protein